MKVRVFIGLEAEIIDGPEGQELLEVLNENNGVLIANENELNEVDKMVSSDEDVQRAIIGFNEAGLNVIKLDEFTIKQISGRYDLN